VSDPRVAFDAAPDVRGVDLLDRGRPRHTSGYLIAAPRPAIVDAGPARSVPLWLRALGALGIPPADIAYLIVTHVHLDHAGGAGALLAHLPGAQVVVHPRGARHLADPSRLVAGAQAVFGGRVDELFGMPQPVPDARLRVAAPDAPLDLGGGHRLRFFDAPGHARHQYMILDEAAGGLFSGDELGGRFVEIGEDYVLPDAAPNQFDPDAMRRSARLLLTLRPAAVLFAHFGRYAHSLETLVGRLEEQLDAFVALGARGPEDAGPAGPTDDQVHARLVEHVRRDLAARGVAWTPAVAAGLEEHLDVSAQGIADYHRRRAAAR
jgi:glyoxylase-like metal-dependent hydrolase (beta-lactamase superfamily II)